MQYVMYLSSVALHDYINTPLMQVQMYLLIFNNFTQTYIVF